MANHTVLMKSSSRQRFNDEEKRKMVDQFYQSGLGNNEFCRKMGINKGSLSQWREKFSSLPVAQIAPVPKDAYSELQKENLSLRTELLALKQAFGSKLIELEMSKNYV